MEPSNFPNTKFFTITQWIIVAGVLGSLFSSLYLSVRLDRALDSIAQTEKLRDSQPDEATEPAPTVPTEASIPDEEAPIPLELRTAPDVSAFLDPVFSQGGKIEEKAQALAEVDGWIFLPEEEEKALSMIDVKVAALGREIMNQVKLWDADALKVSAGKQAIETFSQGSSLLALYPMPNDEAAQRDFSDFLAVRDAVSRKIQELRRLRYNQWAIEQIEAGYMGYHANLAKVQKWDEDPKLVDSAATNLQTINPDFLDVSAMELYMGLIRLTNESVDEAHKIKLAKLLNNPAVSKKSPEDF